ncbi:phage protein (plasmid) [Ralstonia syzygii subsp. celebesensis]|uniref:phage protein n=1 Tax=Ralstonia syzygii TaxID=28097 RepID=UPI00387E128C
MTQQWIRRVSLIVGDDGSKGLDLSELHIVFSIWSATVQSPKHTVMRVYNVSDMTAKTIQKEFTQVALQAGYGDNFGQIFTGSIKQVRKGRANATDTFIDIVAADGDVPYNFAVMNATLAAGWTAADVYNAILLSLKPYGVTAGYAPDFPSTKGIRGKTMYGMTRDYLRELAQSIGAMWSITNGKLDIIPINGYLPGDAVELTSATGMVGMPAQTVDGILVKCLLNPNIRPGGLLKINNASIQKAAISTDYQAKNYFPSLDDDGFYKVYAMTQTGDTRGQNFYTELICTGVNGTAPLTSTYTNAVVSNGS